MMNNLTRAVLLIIFSLCISFSTLAEKNLVGKVIWCSIVVDDAVGLMGYKFLQNGKYEHWGQSTIVAKSLSTGSYSSNFNYIFLHYEAGDIKINRTTLDFTVPNLTLHNGENCEVNTPKSDDFEKLFDLKYAQIVAAAKKLKKI